ncbi:hypothetical protein LIER_11096 [Lithospermum erythrorhizon]|uniref:CCHC-type domain-containing protein n=1 Tax=Lithospermum erythrorhizon TaxID=34254 RepID=A0AAV3PLP7_LITER
MHAQKLNRRHKEEDDQVLKDEERSYMRGRNNGPTRGRYGNSRGSGRSTFNKATLECFKCHKTGHVHYECPTWNKEANYVAVDDEDDLLLMTQIEEISSKRNDVWYLDSWYSNHMSSQLDLFSSIDRVIDFFVNA